ncbi:MAG: DUF2127 domain-containing protein [Candidatus Saccharimonadia bacterium]
MPNLKRTKISNDLFQIGLIGKAIDGVLEIFGGIVLYLSSGTHLSLILQKLINGEIRENPTSPFSKYLLHSVQSIQGGHFSYATVYLISHGVVKIFLVVQVFRHKLWAYIALIVFLLGFAIFQVFQIAANHSLILSAITIFDLGIAYLSWHEYQQIKKTGI